MTNNALTPTQQIANRLSELAKRAGLSEAKLSDRAGLSPSYLSKAKKGVLKELPEKYITAWCRALAIQPPDLYRDLDLPLPFWLHEGAGAPLFPEEDALVKLHFPYVSTVPDHTWPVLVRDLFRNFNFELVPEPMSLLDFKSCLAELDDRSSPTMVVMPLGWWANEHGEFRRGKLEAVIPTHTYHGFALIGRHGFTIPSLEGPGETVSSDLLGSLFTMIAEMIYYGVLPLEAIEGSRAAGTIACFDKIGQKFIEALFKIAKADRGSLSMFSKIQLAPAKILEGPSQTFLEPLDRVGHNRIDFVVGHALTLAAALAATNPPRYKIFSTYRHLQQLVKLLESREFKADEATIASCVEAVDQLQQPVFICLGGNFPEGNREKVALRLCGLAARVAERELAGDLPTRLAEHLQTLLPRLSDSQGSARHLQRAWRDSYDFENFERILAREKEPNTWPKFPYIDRFIDCAKYASAHADQIKDTPDAAAHMQHGNYYDAAKKSGWKEKKQ